MSAAQNAIEVFGAKVARTADPRREFCAKLASETLQRLGLRGGCRGQSLALRLGIGFYPVIVTMPEIETGRGGTAVGWRGKYLRYPWGGHGGPSTQEANEEHASRWLRLRVAEFLLRGKRQAKMPAYVECLAACLATEKAKVHDGAH